MKNPKKWYGLFIEFFLFVDKKYNFWFLIGKDAFKIYFD